MRGFRIELGEIEAALACHPKVRDARVLALSDDDGQHSLVAYVVADPRDVSVSELCDHLRSKLPEYMVPSGLRLLNALPLTANGKLDRCALPPVLRSADRGREAKVSPRTEAEHTVARIFAEVLRLEDVGIHDNFFQLGGHSLAATRATAHIARALGRRVSLRLFFDSPTVASLIEAIDAAPSQASAVASEPPEVAREAVGLGSHLAPLLSSAQERMWFLERLVPNSAAYNVATALRLRGPLDCDALEQSLNDLVARHAVLRSTFGAVEGEPVMAVRDELLLSLVVDDLTTIARDAREARAVEILSEDAATPFDLARGPLVRARLLRLADEDHLFLFNQHHIVTDGWSVAILWRDLGRLYTARVARQSPDLARPVVQFADHAARQRASLSGERLASELAYWRAHLEGAPPSLELPTDRPRPELASYRGDRVSVVLSSAQTTAVRRLGEASGVTPFMVLLAAWSGLLHRYSGQSVVVVGTPVANRTLAEFAEVPGLFVNTLPLAIRVAEGVSFMDLLSLVKHTLLESLDHQEIPFEKIVSALSPDRVPGQSPIFQAMLVFQNTPNPLLELPRVATEAYPVPNRSAKFDLTLHLNDGDEQIAGTLEYSLDLFEEATACRMARHFVTLLEEALERPRAAIASLPLLSPDERHLIERAHPAPGAPKGGPRLLHEPFFEVAARTPDRIAVVSATRTLTYGELAREARGLASSLTRRGAKPSDLIAVMMGKGWEQVVAVLGVLSAGCGYVPVDPTWPRERAATVLEQARTRFVLTQPWLAPVIQSTVRREIPIVPVTAADRTVVTDATDAARAVASDLAYVIFTSGSTGVPKGVMIEHASALNTILDLNERFEVGPSDRAIALSALHFDLSVYDIFGTLTAGATLVIPEPDALRDPEQLLRIVHEHGITVWNSVPAFMQLLTEAAAQSDGRTVSTLRLLLLGGDWIPVDLPAKIRARMGQLRIVNLGGATEASIMSTFFPIEDVDPRWKSFPYGWSLANQRVQVLNGAYELCPIGVRGELFFSGAGLARGYLGDEARTNASFLKHPETGERLYRTGDWGRYRADGSVECLGREDGQVKIRGYRIELGEIEAALARHPAIQSAVAVVRNDGPDDRRLVAYYTPDPHRPPTENELRSFVREKVPEYMVPAAFVEVERIPVSSNGKRIRSELPPPLPRRSSGPSASLTPIEAELAELWREVLRVADVQPESSFFGLGGHSLLAVSLMAKIERRFGKSPPVSALFRRPTLGQLAALLEVDASEPKSTDRVVPITGAGTRPPLFLVHGAGGGILRYRELAYALGPERPVYGLEAVLDSKPTSIQSLAKQYLAAIARVVGSGPLHLGGWSLGGIIALEMAQQLSERGNALGAVVLIDSVPLWAVSRAQNTSVDTLDSFARDAFGDTLPGPLRTLDDVLTAAVAARRLAPEGQIMSRSSPDIGSGRTTLAAAQRYEPAPLDGRALHLLRCTAGGGRPVAGTRALEGRCIGGP